ncbi:cytidine deaminase [Brachybacterium muris]|uniref:cytidine deaminase n=1 Tax=Brachybacterium muris TaxID=219301 RepID=UPI0021A4765A|nr:cytidine deaminase [Brachybacterium muris]MCT1432069.1 cytidine deaminase [Brachybacterium muris]
MTEDDPGTGQVPEPFADLLAVAREMAARAYAPYSRYRVGAAARVDDGRTVRGCNVENAGYGVTLCAECGMVSELIAGGGGKLTAFVCVNGQGEVIMPCGRCRQLLSEHAARDFTILTPLGVRDLDEILPQAFGPQDMAGI